MEARNYAERGFAAQWHPHDLTNIQGPMDGRRNGVAEQTIAA